MVLLFLVANAGAPGSGRARPRQNIDAQLLNSVSDPMPVGVLIEVQVPLATYFQAFFW